MGVEVTSFYRFATISADELDSFVLELRSFAEREGVLGLVVLAREGINATISLPSGGREKFKQWLGAWPNFVPRIFKDSEHHKHPFRRFKIDVRPEIVTFGDPDTVVDESDNAERVSPAEWHKLLEENPDALLIDVRNSYEIELGKFRGARDPRTTTFTQFAKYLEDNSFDKERPLLMYCTGGIRCEKAAPRLKALGFKQVIHLDGGILNYMQHYPDGHYEGECFVFDHRVALDNKLAATERVGLCPHCGDPAALSIVCDKCAEPARVCERCLQRGAEKRSCSKNCAYYLKTHAPGEGVAGDR